MQDSICYLNGDYLRESEAKVSVLDHALWRGNAVFDMGRSYNHVPLFWQEHIDRLYRSLGAVHLDPGLTREMMLDISFQVFDHNKKNLDPLDDFGIAQWVGGGTPNYLLGKPTKPNVLVVCYYISPQYEVMAKNYKNGIRLVVVNTRQIPPQCLDARIKHTSRWCNQLADLEAKMIDPEAWALMLDINGSVAEGPIFNCFIVRDGKLFTPKLGSVLAGVTRGTVLKLAEEIGIESVVADLSVYDFYNADEIFITHNSPTITPVSRFNDRELEPIPGPITKQLYSTFSKLVGFDIVQRPSDYIQARETKKNE